MKENTGINSGVPIGCRSERLTEKGKALVANWLSNRELAYAQCHPEIEYCITSISKTSHEQYCNSISTGRYCMGVICAGTLS